MQCEEVLSIFPAELKELVSQMELPPGELQELRIRAGRPLLAVCGGREYRSEDRIRPEQIGEILAYLGNYSLYAYEDEIRQGFLSLPGGHRVGLAGRAVLERGRIRTLTEVSSLNIRFAHQIRGCAVRVVPLLWEGDRLCHTLIVSAPGKGKTTLLRDCIRLISDGNAAHRGRTVGVVDERMEIAGSFRGLPGNDVGIRTDVLDACPKAEGMLILIRSMAPEVVAVDEVGAQEDVAALQYAMHCGCVLLATVHGGSLEELRRRPALREMIDAALFERYIVLEAGSRPGRVKSVLDGKGRPLRTGENGC